MKKLLLNVSYEDEKRNYWQDSYLENETVTQKDNETIHETIEQALEEYDGVEMSYNGEPQDNIYRDINGESKQVGYIYRVKQPYMRTQEGYTTALFSAWVEIQEVTRPELESTTNNDNQK